MDLYYNDDLSLAEIAETFGITRQAVRETVKKTEADLRFYEEKLGLLRRFKEAETHAQKALALCESTATVPDTLREEIRALCAVVTTPDGV